MARSNIFAQMLVAAAVVCSTASSLAQISVVGQLTDDRIVAAGSRYDGTITVRNETDEPQEVKVYQTDYFFRFDGTTLYGEPGEHSRSNAGWISFIPALMRLEPHATSVVNYSVTVPESAGGRALSGSYWSMLMVEGIAPGSPESSEPRPTDRTNMGVSQLIRYGVQIASHVTGTGRKEVQFLDVRVQTESDGSRQLIVDVQNTGEVWFRPAFSAEIFDDSGNSRAVLKGSTFRMYPGTSVRQRIDLGSLPRGKYTIVLILDAGGEDVFGAEYTLTL